MKDRVLDVQGELHRLGFGGVEEGKRAYFADEANWRQTDAGNWRLEFGGFAIGVFRTRAAAWGFSVKSIDDGLVTYARTNGASGFGLRAEAMAAAWRFVRALAEAKEAA